MPEHVYPTDATHFIHTAYPLGEPSYTADNVISALQAVVDLLIFTHHAIEATPEEIIDTREDTDDILDRLSMSAATYGYVLRTLSDSISEHIDPQHHTQAAHRTRGAAETASVIPAVLVTVRKALDTITRQEPHD